jgi:hypothetical protein
MFASKEPDICTSGKAPRIFNAGLEGKRGDRANPWHAYQACGDGIGGGAGTEQLG